MFVLRSEQVISPGRTEDYAVYEARSIETAREQLGLLLDLRLVYLGNFARRLIYQAWETREDRLAYSRGRRWVRTPEGVLVGPALSGFYEAVADAMDMAPEPGQCVLDRHFRVSNGRQEEFEALETGLCDLAKGEEGFVSRASLKFLGNDTGYVRLSTWQSWGHLLRWIGTPGYASENDAILSRVVWTTADRYEIVAVAARLRLRGAGRPTAPGGRSHLGEARRNRHGQAGDACNGQIGDS